MIEFAKLHVEASLKAAANNAETNEEAELFCLDKLIEIVYIDN